MNPADTSPPRCVLHVEAASRQSQRPDRRLVMSSAHPNVRTAPGLGGPGGQRRRCGPGVDPGPHLSPWVHHPGRAAGVAVAHRRGWVRARSGESGPARKGAGGQDCRWPRVA